jgi:prepilin-type N-terminal cleavage/methylation domain-containing protein
MRMRRLLRLARSESGHTLIELLSVMIILGIVLGSLTTLFVSGAKAELDTNKRFQAQTQARTAVDRLRREVHCASAVSVGGGGSSAVVTLPAHCPTSGGSIANITYDTILVSSNRYRLRRAGTIIADYLSTNSSLFAYTAPSASALGQLHVDMSVNINPNEGWKRWHLVTDIVLRNTLRS